jgi:hypothetical protein
VVPYSTETFFSSIHSLLFFLFKLVAIRLELFNLIHPFAFFMLPQAKWRLQKSSNTYGNYIHFFLPSLSLDSCHAPFSTAGQPPFFSSILRPLGEFVARGKTSRTALMRCAQKKTKLERNSYLFFQTLSHSDDINQCKFRL